jgi:hypothetical protein
MKEPPYFNSKVEEWLMKTFVITCMCITVNEIKYQNVLKFYQQHTGEEWRMPFIFDDLHFCRARVIGLDMTENRSVTEMRNTLKLKQ